MIDRRFDNLSDYANYLKDKCNDILKSGDYIENNEISNAIKISKNNKIIKKIKDEEITNYLNTTISKTKKTFLVKKRKNISYKKKSPNKNYGRLKKDLKEKETKTKRRHNQNDATNGKKRAIVHCIHSYYSEIKFLFPKYKLLEITITNQIETDKDIKILSDKSIEDIIFNSKPRKRNDPNYFKNKINEIINNNDENVKKLNILLHKKFKEIIILYLEDKTKFEYFEEDENSIEIYNFNNFETFKNGLCNVTKIAKERIKDNLLNLLGYKKTFNQNKLNEIEH